MSKIMTLIFIGIVLSTASYAGAIKFNNNFNNVFTQNDFAEVNESDVKNIYTINSILVNKHPYLINENCPGEILTSKGHLSAIGLGYKIKSILPIGGKVRVDFIVKYSIQGRSNNDFTATIKCEKK
jgi:hypothetical protein